MRSQGHPAPHPGRAHRHPGAAPAGDHPLRHLLAAAPGLLYSHAKQEGFSKIALGHHLDDLIETLLINQFFEGRISTMPLKLVSDDGGNTVIRPLGTCEEEDLRRYAWLKGYPIVPCGCPLCGASVLESRRAQIKALVATLRESIPDLKFSLLKAMGNVKSSHLLDGRLPPIT